MPNRHPSDAEGLLNLHKPLGMTSHDVVARVRRLTGVPRVGHAGTLDPQASGVLLIGIGKGTKLTQFLHECPKTYRATLRLGLRTDTHDATGKIVDSRPVQVMSIDAVRAVLATFEGMTEQVPPMYSAVKWQGKRLYTLARQGIEVDRQPRRVQIFHILLLALAHETLSFDVSCSAGTYIRVLADDIGQRLGCGAHLTELVRTAIGPFTLSDALTLPAFEEAARQGTWRHALMPLSCMGTTFPTLAVTPMAARAIAQGIPPSVCEISHLSRTIEGGETVALVGADGTLLAMASASFRSIEWPHVSPNVPAVRLRRVLVGAGRSVPPADQIP